MNNVAELVEKSKYKPTMVFDRLHPLTSGVNNAVAQFETYGKILQVSLFYISERPAGYFLEYLQEDGPDSNLMDTTHPVIARSEAQALSAIEAFAEDKDESVIQVAYQSVETIYRTGTAYIKKDELLAWAGDGRDLESITSEERAVFAIEHVHEYDKTEEAKVSRRSTASIEV